ncbi:MAG: DUF3139 domain-containing protein [Oscillospiraceae bacterium]|nr:DUF3139 domain-containing protein [Oscillospiraceae bacterium]
MKKKILLAILSCVLILALGVGAYAVFGGIAIKNRTLAYLESQGYSSADIQSVQVKTYYAIAGFRWETMVVFVDEPGVTYYYCYDFDKIIYQSGYMGPTADKDALKHKEG